MRQISSLLFPSSFFNNGQSKLYDEDVYLEIIEKLRNEGIKASLCHEGFRVYRCMDCGHQWVSPHFCQSRLCVRCSDRLHKIRVAKCLRKIGKYEGWSHAIFTLPSELWNQIVSWRDVRGLRQAAIRIARRFIGDGGVSVVHTFSSQDESRWQPHVHLLVFNRKCLLWARLRKAWAIFLRRRFGYEGEVNVYEKPFHRGRLAHRLRYVLRLPAIRFDTMHHFAICKGKAYYSFFGVGINQKTQSIPFTENLCPECGSKYCYLIARFSKDRGWWYAEGWDRSDITVIMPDEGIRAN
jgi:hypothetical protein